MITSWYRQKVSDFGFLRATWALSRIAWGRAYVRACNAFLAKRIECPCCGWQGRRLFDYVEIGYIARNVSCPQCDSHPRHRAFFLWLRDPYQLDQKTGTAVIFAPERALAPLWNTAKRLKVLRIDIEPSRGVDVIGDIMCLPLASRFAELVWCHHVLDQVQDDGVALQELHRVLSGTGDLIISVSETALRRTQEFGFADKALSGNRRAYGGDFPGRLTSAGFRVERVDFQLSDSDSRRYAIHDEPFYVCRRDSSSDCA